MKKVVLCLTALLMLGAMSAQTVAAPDTLLVEDFEQDPTPGMGFAPSGFDQIWINYDADALPTECGDNVPVPGGWFWEGDLSKFGDPAKSTITSCSYFGDNESLRNQNWLILPPITMPDSSYQLSWRSQPYQGPAWLDGYLVLVSASTNIPEEDVFTDTLFKAAEMLSTDDPTSRNLNDYDFSEGYIHAAGFTLTEYYDLDTLIIPGIPPFTYYRGKFEPHSVSLAQYSGQTIYIAFLHNSQSDYLLQLDDIVVSKMTGSSAPEQPAGLKYFHVQPNPIVQTAVISWELDTPQEGQLRILDLHGRTVWEASVSTGSGASGRLSVEAADWPPGLYLAVFNTAKGSVSRRLIKQ